MRRRSTRAWPSAASKGSTTTTATCTTACLRCRTSTASWSAERGRRLTAMAVRVLVGEGAARDVADGDAVELDARRSHHLVRVLRLGVGEAVEAFDGRGSAFVATVAVADARRCRLQLGARLERAVEGALAITRGQCLSTADKMDWTIEKAVALGVAAIVPLASARSQLRLDADRAQRKLGHWRNIVESACTQSGRSLLPTLSVPRRLADFVDDRWPE